VTPAQGTTLVWHVDDITDAGRRMSAGAVFNRCDFMTQDDLEIRTTPDGAQVAWFNDPVGNTVSLTRVAD
jgi:hypothetical protein